MKTKHWVIIGLVLVLGGLSIYLNTDWFGGDTIQISHRIKPVRTRFIRRNRPPAPAAPAVFFEFDRKLKLTAVQVQSLADIATNKYPHPFWHLVSDSNSPPTQGFTYGAPIPGMRPYFKGAEPEPLAPGAKYRLLLEAGPTKAQHDFEVTAPAP